ncbi:MAG TPA: response regulator [Thermoanaerobaculia bacterium]|nr:response regulator [Thermoanaerobaculia bacterium]
MPPSTDLLAARILIVDDQSSNVRLLEHTLRRGGYADISSTTDPRTVGPMHLENRYDLILLDLQMPVMNGFEVMHQLRGMEGGSRVAILVISADPSHMLAALEAGGSSFLSKPFKLPDVLERVGVMLEKRQDPAARAAGSCAR